MYRLSLIISEIYNKYLPLAEKGGVSLNLDFSDTTQTVADPEAIKSDLDKHLSSALSRSDRGAISIAVEQDAIIVTDSGTILSKPICALLSKGRVSVNSRVGFGTTVRISLLPPEPVQGVEPIPSAKEPLISVKPKSAPAKLATNTQSAKTAIKTSSAKSKQTTKTKPTREQRKLASAAKKADRKIQKLRKNQQKSQKKSKPTNSTSNRPAKATTNKPVKPAHKPTKTKRKKIIELS